MIDPEDETYTEYIRRHQAFFEISAHTEADDDFVSSINERKRAMGPAFECAEIYSGCAPSIHDDNPDYFVFEPTSRVVFTFAHSTRAEALCAAREIILNCGDETLKGYFDDRLAEFAKAEAVKVISYAARQPKPRKIGKRMKAIFEESNGLCHYCQTVLTLDGKWHIEHKMPRALGGSDEPTNLVAACVPCNSLKRDRTDIEFFALREKIANKKSNVKVSG